MSCNLYSVWKHHVHEICEIAWSSQRFFITEFFRGKGNNCFKSWQINHFMNYNKYEHLYQHIRSQWMSLYRTFFYWSVKINLLKIKENIEHVQEISSVIKYVTSLLTQLSHSVCGLFFFWTVVCCGIWSWNAWLTNNITAFLWRIHNEGSTVLLVLEKIIYQVTLIHMLCQKEIDRRKSLYFFIMMCHPLQDVMWCFS